MNDLPPANHDCEPANTIPGRHGELIEKCLCGGWRHRRGRGYTAGYWQGINSIRAANVRWYDEDSYPWLKAQNADLKTFPGIIRQREKLDKIPNLAELIVMNVNTERAREHFADKPLPQEFNERLMKESSVAMDVAESVGAAHMFVSRGWVDSIEEMTITATVAEGLAIIHVRMPFALQDGRCLPEAGADGSAR